MTWIVGPSVAQEKKNVLLAWTGQTSEFMSHGWTQESFVLGLLWLMPMCRSIHCSEISKVAWRF